MDEVGDNRHTTFFEMLGNWSLGDYFKQEQLPWLFEFLVEVVGLNPSKLYVTCFIGDQKTGIEKDIEAAAIWKQLFASKGIDAQEREIGSEQDGYQKGMGNARIFYYDAEKNWWSRMGVPSRMAIGEPGGPDSEVFYDLGIPHDAKWGAECHPNCDCGRFLEIGNSVFMAYKKTEHGFDKLSSPNVDFGGGLERIAAAALDTPDVFKISVLWPIIKQLEKLTQKAYADHNESMRVIADHLRAVVLLITDGASPSNKEQGYVVRRLMRRSIRFAFDLGVEKDLCSQLAPKIIDIYHQDFPEVGESREKTIQFMVREEKIFRETLRKGLRVLDKFSSDGLTGEELFTLYDTYGFPLELSLEEAQRRGIGLAADWHAVFDRKMAEQRERSQTAGKGVFKGGLADHSLETTKLHTATHLLYEALRRVLGEHVVQRGSNVTAERTRFDFSHPEKVTPEQLRSVEQIVNEQIDKDLQVTVKDYPTKEAFERGAKGAFGDKYGDIVKVYSMGRDDEEPFSVEICGGPHVAHTGVLAEGGKRFKIIKEEASSAGVRRIKAILG
jgi:alanyl-tRNA synthetase